MKAQLIYKSSWCTAIPTIYEQPTIDENVDRFIGKVFANRTQRAKVENGKYVYAPSDEYIRHSIGNMRKIS